MRKPEEIKKGLECCILETDDTSLVDHCKACPYQPNGLCFRTLLEDAFAYIRQLEQIVADFTKRTVQFEAQLGKDINVPRWISVEERLPEKEERVLFFAEEPRLTMDTAFGWWVNTTNRYKITHWMSLPNPPKEDKHGNKYQKK